MLLLSNNFYVLFFIFCIAFVVGIDNDGQSSKNALEYVLKHSAPDDNIFLLHVNPNHSRHSGDAHRHETFTLASEATENSKEETMLASMLTTVLQTCGSKHVCVFIFHFSFFYLFICSISLSLILSLLFLCLCLFGLCYVCVLRENVMFQFLSSRPSLSSSPANLKP